MTTLLALLRRIQVTRPGALPLGTGDPQNEAVRLRAPLHLGYAAAEVESATPPATADDRWDLEVTLPALYGPGSPLPAYMTERLMPEAARPARALLDALNHRLLSLQVRVAMGDRDETESVRADRLARVLGWGERSDLLRWAWAWSGVEVASADLDVALRDACDPTPVRLEQCVPERAVLPDDARARLGERGRPGARLGVDAALGETVRSRATAFAVVVGPIAAADVPAWVPGGERRRLLDALVQRANPERLACRVIVLVVGTSLMPVRLGEAGPLPAIGRLAGTPPESYELVDDRSAVDTVAARE